MIVHVVCVYVELNRFHFLTSALDALLFTKRFPAVAEVLSMCTAKLTHTRKYQQGTPYREEFPEDSSLLGIPCGEVHVCGKAE